MAKTTSKTSTKKKFTLNSKFSSFGFKGKLLLFVLAFAVIGGGYYAYRSFAATAERAYVTIDSMEGGERVIDYGSSNKKNPKVRILGAGYDNHTQITPEMRPSIWAPYVRACVVFRVYKRSGNNIVMSHEMRDKNGTMKSVSEEQFKPYLSSDYMTHCGDLLTNHSAELRHNILVLNNGNGVYVQNYFFILQDSQ